MTDDEIRRRADSIRLLALDVDGVLTDGGVYVLEDGTEFRRFDIKDGLGLKRVMEAGFEVAIISASFSRPVIHRAQTLGIKQVHLGIANKLQKLGEICKNLGIELSEVAYMGDDLADLPMLEEVGLFLAPSDAFNLIKNKAAYVTSALGGKGSVREVCELLLSCLPREN